MSQQTEKPQGRLYAIGTGPGASDLITVRGARIISELDILYAPAGKKDAPSLAHTIVAPYITGKTTVKTYHFLMKAPQEAKEAVWDDVAKAIQEDVADGKKVGFPAGAYRQSAMAGSDSGRDLVCGYRFTGRCPAGNGKPEPCCHVMYRISRRAGACDHAS